MQNLENLDFFDFDYTKTAKMPEGPFCQIRAHIFIVISLAGLPSLPSTNLAFSEKKC